MYNLSLNKSRLTLLKSNEHEMFLRHGDIRQTASKWKELILRLKNKNDNKEKFE
jgi:hypothetical protein